MDFSNTSTKGGIIQQIEHKSGLGDGAISNNATLLKQITAEINNGYSRIAQIIIKSDGNMRWDDPNHSDSPVADFNLVSGQKNYNVFESAPAALQDWLEIDRIEILDSSDNGVLLEWKPNNEINVAISEFESVSGTPKYVRLNGTEIFMDPAPNYSKTSGGTIYFNRCPSYFVSTDTTKRPGIPTIFHEMLVLYPLYDIFEYKTKDHNQADRTANKITSLEGELEDYYGRRVTDKPSRMRPARHDNR